jgi:hypothetical protein
MIDFGPQIAIIDDRPDEVQGIMDYLGAQNVGYQYFNADITEAAYPQQPLESVELIFLDLYYSAKFDPDQCAQWVDEIVPENRQYELIIWSKDSHRTEEVIDTLLKINKAPRVFDTKQKSDYQDANGIEQLIKEVKEKISQARIEEFIGEILDIQDDCVIIDCLIDEENEIFQKRRFEIEPFKNFINLKKEIYITIKVITKAGSISYEFLNNPYDEKEKFSKDGLFDGIDENSFV